jgi:hypothetical protein
MPSYLEPNLFYWFGITLAALATVVAVVSVVYSMKRTRLLLQEFTREASSQQSSTGPADVQYAEEDLKQSAQIAATGWWFERILRVIFPAQLEMLLALASGATMSDDEAVHYYNMLPDDLRKLVPYAAFVEFMLAHSLVRNEPTSQGANRFTITSNGQKFLHYRQLVANGVPWPFQNVYAEADG